MLFLMLDSTLSVDKLFRLISFTLKPPKRAVDNVGLMLKYFEQHFLGLAILNVCPTDHLTYYCSAKTFIDLTSIF